MKMIVRIQEVWVQNVLVEVGDGDGEEEAIKAAEAGNFERLELEYSHTLPSAAWSTGDTTDAETRSRAPKPPQREDSKKKKRSSS